MPIRLPQTRTDGGNLLTHLCELLVALAIETRYYKMSCVVGFAINLCVEREREREREM